MSRQDFRGVDYFNIDELLTEEERMVRDTVRDFVSEKVIPIIEHHNRESTFPAHLIKPMAELNLFGASFQGYGCAGLSSVAYGLVLQELERGDSGLRSFASVQSGLCMFPIYKYASNEQKEKWLPAMAKGEKIGCFGLTEPDYGSNPGGMITRAKLVGDKWVLNGAKMWITNGGVADLAIVWAKDETDTIRGFIVEKGTPGYTTKDTHGKWSLRASVTSELIFQDCAIPKENALNVNGLKGPLSCLTQARYGIAWGAIGAAMAVYDEALDYSKTRIQFDKPIGSFQLVQNKLVWMLNEITKAQLMCLRLGRLKDENKMRFQQVSMAKRNNVWMALESARMARDVLGANGITDEYQCMRHMCNLESVYTYEGTHDIHTLILGEDITGLAAYY